MGVGRDDHHHVRPDAIRALGARRLPVREVADLDEHRHPDLVDVERQRLLLDLDVRTPRSAAAPPARSAPPARRCRPCVLPASPCSPSRRRGRPATSIRCQLVGPSSAGIAAHSSGFWNQLVPSSRLRSRWSPPAPLTTTGCTVERHDQVGVGDEVDLPRVRRGDELELGRFGGRRLLASVVRTIT